jgi:hypothetical protein
MYTPEIKRDLSVNFSIEEVKNSINVVCENSKSFYQIKDKNDIMNSYTIWLLGGVMVQTPVSIQLKKISDTETNILLNTTKPSTNPNQSNNTIDSFLGLVSKSLSGEVITEDSVSKGKSGCLGTIIGMIVFTGTLSYFLLS